ncbi:hypothetical protein [Pelomonas sp. Root1444]|uniref:hypothetical protein n=1 Tax=Pelomonas sp. Root1444 TaxID=1736464 RepID=UPI0007026330|nr:hypothetical protein [Pelomonas sp. Root1444]KQY83665.1 hypothetical protein ASD35_24385 [Pelomonas sp. Root1444]
MKVTLTGFEQAQRKLASLDKQARYAASLTLNTLARYPVQDAVRHEMRDSLDRPTPFTLNSLSVTKRATAADLTAVVDFKQVAGGSRPASDYLRWQVSGGQRRLKGFEVALRSIGVLPGGYFVTPGQGAKMDAYGNVSRGQIVAILSYFRAFREEGRGFKMNSTAATRARLARGTRSRLGFRYFVGRPGGRGQLGIYQDVRIAAGVRELLPVFIFVQWARYEPRLDVQAAADLAVKREAAPIFQAALAQALRTAR